MTKFVYLLLLVPAYVLAQQCMVRVLPGNAFDLGPPNHMVLTHVDVLLPDGGGKMVVLKDGGTAEVPLKTYSIEVDPMWTGQQKLEEAERVCGLYWQEEDRRTKASAFCNQMDAGWSKVVDAG